MVQSCGRSRWYLRHLDILAASTNELQHVASWVVHRTVAIMTLVSLPYHLVLPVSLFFAWGVLTGLSEIHDLLLDEEVA